MLPAELVRFLASMPGFVYAQGPAGAIFVNLYVSSECPSRSASSQLALSSRARCRGAATRHHDEDSDESGCDQAAHPRLGARSGRAPWELYSYSNARSGKTVHCVHQRRRARRYAGCSWAT